MKTHTPGISCPLAVLLCSCAVALAQGTGAIHGTVSDPAGLGVPQAKVTATLTERGTVRTAESDARGEYLLPQAASHPSARDVSF